MKLQDLRNPCLAPVGLCTSPATSVAGLALFLGIRAGKAVHSKLSACSDAYAELYLCH